MADNCIDLRNVSKKFKIGSRKPKSALYRILSFFSGVSQKQELWALKNVSFKVAKGENIGIIGKNGCGKTTLLRSIAGIYKINRGELNVDENVTFLSGLSSGLKGRLTVIESIPLVGSIMGLSQKDIKKNIKSIVNYAGLGEFINTKIYKLSSGMVARLAFSITMHCISHLKPDILLLDEVFLTGGGDEEFKNKGIEKVRELVKGSTTVVIASHKMPIIRNYCSRVIWIHKGKIVEEGGAHEVVNNYLEFTRSNKRNP